MVPLNATTGLASSGSGLNTLPDRDIRDLVEEHRERFGPSEIESAPAERGRR